MQEYSAEIRNLEQMKALPRSGNAFIPWKQPGLPWGAAPRAHAAPP